MAFAFEHDDGNVEAGLLRIVVEQIDKALNEASAPEAAFDETVHQLRRRCKNLRGLLRIVQGELDVFRAEDGAVREIAGRLAHLRDAAVMMETFDSLVGKDGAELGEQDRQPLRSLLAERNDALTQQLDQQVILGDFRQAMAALRGRAEGWTLRHKQFRALEDGIEETYRRMRTRMREAATDGLPTTLHAWRKQAKYHRHHMMLLRRHAPDMLDGRSKLLAELADLLGNHHDLAVLVEVLAGRAAPGSPALATILAVAGERQEKLEAQAFALGEQIAAEKPKALTRRLKQYWALEGKAA